MKRIAKKSLAVLLAFIFATTMFVTAFAEEPALDEILFFSADINYETNQLNYFSFIVNGFSVLNEDAFACSIFDSEGNEIFDQSMGEVTAMSVGDIGFEEDIEMLGVDISLTETVILNPDETYTLEIYADSFSTADGAMSEEIAYDFLPSDYIYIPTIWDKILWVLHSNSFFEFIFARVIMIIEFFYYSPWFQIFLPV